MNPFPDPREMFHLNLLEALALRLASRAYAVKGGIALRFFHGSPRLSEDMDLDVTPRMPVATLQKNVQTILDSGSLKASLQRHGISRFTSTAPKQTPTTQRWKMALELEGGGILSTRLECSRRQEPLATEQGSPARDLLEKGAVRPFIARFYGAETMIHQKIEALASPSRTAARDLFDLDHLLPTRSAFKPPLFDPDILAAAIQKARAFKRSDFQEQVIPYLPEDWGRRLGDADSFRDWHRMATGKLEALRTGPSAS